MRKKGDKYMNVVPGYKQRTDKPKPGLNLRKDTGTATV